MDDTRTLVGDELLQAKNYSKKFWLNPENAPDNETLEIIKTLILKDDGQN